MTMLDGGDLKYPGSYQSCYFTLYTFNLPTLVSLNTHASLSSLSCVGSEKREMTHSDV